MLRFVFDKNNVDPVELQYRKVKSALVTLNAIFEAARAGNAGRLLSLSASEIEPVLLHTPAGVPRDD
jgi:hypothetical protein